MESGTWNFVVNEGMAAPERPRFLSWTPDSILAMANVARPIWGIEQFGVRFNSPISNPQFDVRDTTGVAIELDGYQPDPSLYLFNKPENSDPFVIQPVDSQDSTSTGVFQFSDARNSGALVLETQGANGPVIVEVFSQDSIDKAVLRVSSAESSVLLGGLPGGFRARLRAFVDQDRDGRWNSGRLSPYESAEPMGWVLSNEPVRARWDTVLPDTLIFGSHE